MHTPNRQSNIMLATFIGQSAFKIISDVNGFINMYQNHPQGISHLAIQEKVIPLSSMFSTVALIDISYWKFTFSCN